MKTFGKLFLTLGLLGLVAAPAMAQGGRGFGGGGGTMLLSNKSVQEELKASSEQVEKLNALGTKLSAKQREEGQKIRDLSEDERPAKQRELMQTMMTEIKTGLGEILKPEQVKRFEQIQLQQAGTMAFGQPKVQEALKITEEQKTKIRDLGQEYQPKIREAMQGFQDDREAAMKKMAELRKEQSDKAMAILTDSQKASWKELTGAPFAVKFEPRPN
jgi:Spy/CpxP family protein refolding chaperone